MKLSEIFNQLTHGEFRMLAIGGATLGSITEANYPAVLAHINLGLTALFTRFTLKEGRILLRPVEGQLVYALDDKFAVNNRRSAQVNRYLIDSASEPFNDDTLIKVERVLDTCQRDLSLNRQDDPCSYFTPSIKSLRIPPPTKDHPLEDVTLVYRQNHAQLAVTMGYFDPARIEVELPYTHLEALLYFVASRVHNPLGMQNEFNMGNNYAQKYEQACQMLEMKNVEADHSTENCRIRRMGWV
jgi:hypothetical protein